MAVLERLGSTELRSVVRGYRDALRAHQEAINRLNVYPVPDGDTGTNMALTLESVSSELATADSMEEVCHAISRGSLMGARGNSGVITSQVLRGLVDGFRSLDEVVAGRPIPEPDIVTTPAAVAAHLAGDNVEGLRYEVMYLLDADDTTIPAFRNAWSAIGDSIVVV